jgi:hypothetical protein
MDLNIHPRFVDENGVISKYAYTDISDVLKSTSIHEITHARQHARFKILPGESYKDAIIRDFAGAQSVPISFYGDEMSREQLLKYFKEVDIDGRGKDDFARIYYSTMDEDLSYIEKLEIYLKYRILNPSEIEAMTRDSITSLSAAKKTGKDTLDNMSRSLTGGGGTRSNNFQYLLASMENAHGVKETDRFYSSYEELNQLMVAGDKLEKEKKRLERRLQAPLQSREYIELVREIEKNSVEKHRVAGSIGKMHTFRNAHLILQKQIEHAKIKYPCAPIRLDTILMLDGQRETHLGTPLGDIYTDIMNSLGYTYEDIQNIATKLPVKPTAKTYYNTFIPIGKNCPKKYVSRDYKRFGAGAIPQKFKDPKGKKPRKENLINDMVNIITEILSID